MTMTLPKFGHRLLAAFIGMALVAGGLAATADHAEAGPRSTDRYLVVSSAPTISRPVDKARHVGGQVLHRFDHVLHGFSAQLSPAQAAQLASDPSVSEVIKDAQYQIDDRVGAQTTELAPPWGLDRIDQRELPLNKRYTYTNTGSGNTVFVLDSGIRLTHSQFKGRAVSGWDFVDKDANASDCSGHGTHVAGTIAGSTYGVAKSVRLVSVRVLDCYSRGSILDMIAGLEWVLAHKPAAGRAVVNMSLGFEVDDGTRALADQVDQAVSRVTAAGIPVVVAAGNSGDTGESSCNFSPARSGKAITVGASTESDARADFSDLGDCVDLYAPGLSVESSWYDRAHPSDTRSAYLSGTSMATPHVSGAVARMLQDDPLASVQSVKRSILDQSTTGVIDGADAAETPNKLLYVTPPSQLASAPTRPSISKSDGAKSVTVRWSTPAGNGGASISGYRVIRTGSADGKGKRVAVANLPASARSWSFTGLAAGGSYGVRVLAITSNGPGAAAAISTKLLAKPGKPGIKKASSGTKKSKGISVTGRWKKPTSGGAVAGYQVKADRVGSHKDKTVKVKAGVYRVKITGLTKNKKYKITVRAVNAAGAGSWSKKSTTVKAK